MNVFLKPTNTKISFREFKKILGNELKFAPFLIMEELSGPAFDVDILTWKGKLIRCIQRMRINTDFPYDGYKIEKNLLQIYARKLLKQWAYHGFMIVQC